MEIPIVGKGNTNPARKGSPVYVGITPHELFRIEKEKKEKENKEKENMENKIIKKIIRRVLER